VRDRCAVNLLLQLDHKGATIGQRRRAQRAILPEHNKLKIQHGKNLIKASKPGQIPPCAVPKAILPELQTSVNLHPVSANQQPSPVQGLPEIALADRLDGDDDASEDR